jgi:hypothetical protein
MRFIFDFTGCSKHGKPTKLATRTQAAENCVMREARLGLVCVGFFPGIRQSLPHSLLMCGGRKLGIMQKLENQKTVASMLESQNMLSSVLDDYVDEEVVENTGTPIGTLACYWESTTGMLFLGIKMSDLKTVRVVPGFIAQLNERHSCIHLGADAATINSAPILDCDEELRGKTEDVANQHFDNG